MSPPPLKPGDDIAGAVLVARSVGGKKHLWRCPCEATFRASVRVCHRTPVCPGCAPPDEFSPGSQAATLLTAAAVLTELGPEFSEFDLTVAAWTLDRASFGLRGYRDAHPNHKTTSSMISKVMLPKMLLERTRANYYRLTDRGRDALAALRRRREAAA